MFKVIRIVGCILLASCTSVIAGAEDAVIADPKHFTVEFENDRVRIIRVRFGPGEKSVMHSHGAHAAVFLTQNKIRLTAPDGGVEETTIVAGAIDWAEAHSHLPENLSDDPLEVIFIELKD